MPRTPNAASMSKNWRDGMSRAGGKYRQSIQDCTVNPMQLAAAKVADGTYLRKVQEAVPRLQQALQSADAGMWKANAMAGAAAWSASIAKGGPKYDRQAAGLAAAGAKASQDAAAATGELEKVRAAINAMKAFAGKPLI